MGCTWDSTQQRGRLTTVLSAEHRTCLSCFKLSAAALSTSSFRTRSLRRAARRWTALLMSTAHPHSHSIGR